MTLMAGQKDDIISLLSEDFDDYGTYEKVRSPVATTWPISFEPLKQRNPLATEYLASMVYLNFKDIPLSIVPFKVRLEQHREAPGALRGFSSTTMQHDDSAVTILRLVHLATRGWLQSQEIVSLWIRWMMARLVTLLFHPDQINKTLWISCMPHAEHVL